MALTYADAKAHVLLACGGDPSTATGLTVPQRVAQILNFAGHHLYSHAWNWRERTAANLDFTANNFVALPDDVGTILNVFPNGNTFRRVFLISPEAFSRFESDNLTITDAVFYVTLSRAKPTDNTQPARRLDIYPAPSAPESAALSIRYRAEFVEVTSADVGESASTTKFIPVESHCEALYLEYVRAFAEGGEVGDTLQRVAMVDASPLLQEAMRRDGVEQPNYGPLPMAVRGRTTSYGGLNFFPNGNIPDPS
jgi:hypothetical protein